VLAFQETRTIELTAMRCDGGVELCSVRVRDAVVSSTKMPVDESKHPRSEDRERRPEGKGVMGCRV
jgi:hypothetical protein